MMRLRLLRPVLVAVSFLTILSFGLLRGEDERASGPTSSAVFRNPVLIELFTSEGCSSCPPADVLLAQLDRFQPVPGADLIVLSEHVDYWDDIGWKDPYSSHQFSLRQADYAHRFRLGEPYTPQMVVDGNTQLVGSDERQAVQAIQNAAKVDKFRISLSAPRLEGSNSLTVQLEVGPTSAAGVKQTSEQVWIALADDMDQSNVKRGENAGRILKHVAVVRTLAQVGTVESNSTFSKDLTVSTGNANLQNLRVVAILQESATGKVLGIGSTRFSYFSLDERVYREFSLRVLFLSRSANRKLRFGLYSLDVTNHQNPHDVYNEVVSPFFGRFAGFDRRLDGFVIDFLN